MLAAKSGLLNLDCSLRTIRLTIYHGQYMALQKFPENPFGTHYTAIFSESHLFVSVELCESQKLSNFQGEAYMAGRLAAMNLQSI